MNNVVLSGTLGKEVKLTNLLDGHKAFNNTIAVTENDEFQWFNVVAYDKLAEYIVDQYQKEEYIIIQGKLKTRDWQGKDSKKHYLTEVLIYRIEGIE